MARTRNIRRRELFGIYKKKYINEFNLISCYTKQEMRLNSLYCNYFCYLLIAANSVACKKNSRNLNYNSILLHSIINKKDNIKLLKFLMANGLNFGISNNYKSKLFFIIKNLNLDILKFIINNEDDKQKINFFMNFMEKIIQIKNLNILKILLKCDILNINNINWIDDNGDTLLIYAIKSNCQEIIQFLIDNGADLLLNNEKIVECLREYYSIDVLKLLVTNGFNINQISEKGVLLLNHFIKDRNGKSNEVAKSLIDCGADVNFRNGLNQEEPIACAIRTRNIDILKYLIDHGANIHYITFYNYINKYYNYNTFCNEYYYEINDLLNTYIYQKFY